MYTCLIKQIDTQQIYLHKNHILRKDMYSSFSYAVLLFKLLQFNEKFSSILENFFEKVQFLNAKE